MWSKMKWKTTWLSKFVDIPIPLHKVVILPRMLSPLVTVSSCHWLIWADDSWAARHHLKQQHQLSPSLTQLRLLTLGNICDHSHPLSVITHITRSPVSGGWRSNYNKQMVVIILLCIALTYPSSLHLLYLFYMENLSKGKL